MTDQPASRSTGLLPSLFGSDPMLSLRNDMNDVLSRFSSERGWFGGDRIPAIDLSETDNAFEMKLDAPGFKPDDISIEVRGDLVQIHGEHKEEKKEDKGKTYRRIERRSGSFSRTMTLPCRVNESKVVADFKDGVLTVQLPKVEGARSHKIKVQG
ncbi:MAG: Hsp20/alpha crystallin family protein [Planctomycetaceae bacterium]